MDNVAKLIVRVINTSRSHLNRDKQPAASYNGHTFLTH